MIKWFKYVLVDENDVNNGKLRQSYFVKLSQEVTQCQWLIVLCLTKFIPKCAKVDKEFTVANDIWQAQIKHEENIILEENI